VAGRPHQLRLGETPFDIWATACSLRTAAWGGVPMTWLHCKAMTAAGITPEEPTGLMAVLIPAVYVTGIRPGPTFRVTRSRVCEDLGVFPPNRPAPSGSLLLTENERGLERLLAPERN
jgi:hypothetical protein